MHTIHKVSLALGTNHCQLPRRASVLTAAMQGGKAVIWWVFDDHVAEHDMRTFRVVLTGALFVGDNCKYVGSCVSDHFDLHVFEELTPMQALIEAVLR